MTFRKKTPALVLTLFLIGHALVVHGLSRNEKTPEHRALEEFPIEIKDWRMEYEGKVEQEVQEVLQADDTLVRTYRRPMESTLAYLYIAYFKSQRTGVAPHSPKHCLPGAGWAPIEARKTEIAVPGREDPIRVNQYTVAKGDQKVLVLYWYQTRNRVIASEYAAKFYLVTDAIRYNRTDTALVRIMMPIINDDAASAADQAEQFVRSCFPLLEEFLPA